MKKVAMQRITRSQQKVVEIADKTEELPAKKRKHSEINYKEPPDDVEIDEKDDPKPKQSLKRVKESEPYKRARYEAGQLIDFAAKEKDDDELRKSVIKFVETALLDPDQDTDPVIKALHEKQCSFLTQLLAEEKYDEFKAAIKSDYTHETIFVSFMHASEKNPEILKKWYIVKEFLIDYMITITDFSFLKTDDLS